MVEREVAFRPEERLDRCEAKGASIAWPIPLDNLVDMLVQLADEEGAKTTRKELVAALVLAAPRDPAALVEHVMAYRKATVADVVPAEAAGDNVIQFQVRRPGPRSRASD